MQPYEAKCGCRHCTLQTVSNARQQASVRRPLGAELPQQLPLRIPSPRNACPTHPENNYHEQQQHKLLGREAFLGISIWQILRRFNAAPARAHRDLLPLYSSKGASLSSSKGSGTADLRVPDAGFKVCAQAYDGSRNQDRGLSNAIGQRKTWRTRTGGWLQGRICREESGRVGTSTLCVEASGLKRLPWTTMATMEVDEDTQYLARRVAGPMPAWRSLGLRRCARLKLGSTGEETPVGHWNQHTLYCDRFPQDTTATDPLTRLPLYGVGFTLCTGSCWDAKDYASFNRLSSSVSIHRARHQ